MKKTPLILALLAGIFIGALIQAKTSIIIQTNTYKVKVKTVSKFIEPTLTVEAI